MSCKCWLPSGGQICTQSKHADLAFVLWHTSHSTQPLAPQDAAPAGDLADAPKLLRGPDASSSGSPSKAAPAASALASSAAVAKAGDGKLSLELPSKVGTPCGDEGKWMCACSWFAVC
jgi:hypothetical protein